MKDDDGVHVWTVSFDAIDCIGCGTTRVRGIRCPDCGRRPDPREVNTALRRRERIISRARQTAADEAAAAGSPVSLDGAMGRARSAVSAFMATLNPVLDKDCDETVAAQELGSALIEVRKLRVDVSATPWRRPFLRVWRGLDSAVEELAKSVGTWVQALESELPVDAQRLSRRAQALLDQAPEELVAATARLDELSAMLDLDDTAEILGVLTHLASERVGGVEWAEEARPLLDLLTDRDELIETLAPGLLVEDERAWLLFDRERFWRVAASTYSTVSGESLARLAGTDDWGISYQRATEQLVDAGEASVAMAVKAFHERQLVRSDLYLAKSLIEGPIKFMLAVMLAIGQRKALRQVSRSDARSILDQVRQTDNRFIVEVINEQLRNADSHEDYFVREGDVVLGDSSAERVISREQLTDEVLAVVETAIALHLGLTVAMLELGDEAAAQAQALILQPIVRGEGARVRA